MSSAHVLNFIANVRVFLFLIKSFRFEQDCLLQLRLFSSCLKRSELRRKDWKSSNQTFCSRVNLVVRDWIKNEIPLNNLLHQWASVAPVVLLDVWEGPHAAHSTRLTVSFFHTWQRERWFHMFHRKNNLLSFNQVCGHPPPSAGHGPFFLDYSWITRLKKKKNKSRLQNRLRLIKRDISAVRDNILCKKIKKLKKSIIVNYSPTSACQAQDPVL